MAAGEGRADAAGFGGAEATVGVDRAPVQAYPAVPADGLVTPAPRWVLAAGGAGVGVLLVTFFLLFWRAMGTAPREAAVEAFGVVLGLLVVVSTVGAFRLAARTPPDGTP